MIGSWIVASGAVVAMAVTGGGIILHLGRVEGRITAVLEQLVKISQDHEERLRDQERSHYNGVSRRPRHG